MLSSPFQCEFCWFANIHEKDCNHWYASDTRQLAYMRQVNLDIFWSREPSTVQNTLSTLRRAKKCSEDIGLPPINIKVGPWPINDKCGFQIAIEMIKMSQGKGRNSESYIQYDSIRKVRSAYANVFESGPVRCSDNRKMKSDKGQISHFVNGDTDSKLFSMFMKGCEKRMGRFVKQDCGISNDMLKVILSMYENEFDDVDTTADRKRFILICGAAFVILWGGALRGGEVMMIESTELIKRRLDGKEEAKYGHIVIPLMGRFKNETGERNLIIILANVTKGGICIRKWVEALSNMLMAEGRHKTIGPAICDKNGVQLEMWKLNMELQSMIHKVKEMNPGLIPEGVVIDERFKLYRSFRRGATTRAKAEEVPEPIIEMNNRWRKFQNKQGSLPNLPMSQLYTDIRQSFKLKLRFSQSI
jgi:hypothetical protein